MLSLRNKYAESKLYTRVIILFSRTRTNHLVIPIAFKNGVMFFNYSYITYEYTYIYPEGEDKPDRQGVPNNVRTYLNHALFSV